MGKEISDPPVRIQRQYQAALPVRVNLHSLNTSIFLMSLSAELTSFGHVLPLQNKKNIKP